MKTNKNRKCGYFIGVTYDEKDDIIRNVKIMADQLVTGLPYISKSRDFDGTYDNETTVALNNLLEVINIADLNTLFSLRISIQEDTDIMNRKTLKEFSFSVIKSLYKGSFRCDGGFKITKKDIDKIYNKIYPSIVKKGGNEYLIGEFDSVLKKAIKYIHNMKLKDIANPDIFIAIECNYDDYIISDKFDINRHSRNIKRYRLETFVKHYIIS